MCLIDLYSKARYCALFYFYVDAEIHPERKQFGQRDQSGRGEGGI